MKTVCDNLSVVCSVICVTSFLDRCSVNGTVNGVQYRRAKCVNILILNQTTFLFAETS